MKKTLAFILTICIIATLVPLCFTANGNLAQVTAGDIDGKSGVSASDAIYLLYHIFFENEEFPINQSCDFNADGKTNATDAIYLLYHIFFDKEDFPLYPEKDNDQGGNGWTGNY